MDRVLREAKPADPPVQAPIKFPLTINLKNAKALGLKISPAILLRADEVSDRPPTTKNVAALMFASTASSQISPVDPGLLPKD